MEGCLCGPHIVWSVIWLVTKKKKKKPLEDLHDMMAMEVLGLHDHGHDRMWSSMSTKVHGLQGHHRGLHGHGDLAWSPRLWPPTVVAMDLHGQPRPWSHGWPRSWKATAIEVHGGPQLVVVIEAKDLHGYHAVEVLHGLFFFFCFN